MIVTVHIPALANFHCIPHTYKIELENYWSGNGKKQFAYIQLASYIYYYGTTNIFQN